MKRKKQMKRRGIFDIGINSSNSIKPKRYLPTPFVVPKVNNIFSWKNPTRNFPLSQGPGIFNQPRANVGMDFLGLRNKSIINRVVPFGNRRVPLFKKVNNPLKINSKPNFKIQAKSPFMINNTNRTKIANLRWAQASGDKRLFGSKYHPFGDADRDGKINFEDCFPFNKRRQSDNPNLEPGDEKEYVLNSKKKTGKKDIDLEHEKTQQLKEKNKGKRIDVSFKTAKLKHKEVVGGQKIAAFVAVSQRKQIVGKRKTEEQERKYNKARLKAAGIELATGPKTKRVLAKAEEGLGRIYEKRKALEKLKEKPVLGLEEDKGWITSQEAQLAREEAKAKKEIAKGREKEMKRQKIVESGAYRGLISAPLDKLKKIKESTTSRMVGELKDKVGTAMTQRYTKQQTRTQQKITRGVRGVIGSMLSPSGTGMGDFGGMPQESYEPQQQEGERGRGRPPGTYKYGLPIDQYKAMQQDLKRQERIRNAMAEAVQQQKIAQINQQAITQGQNMTPEQLQALLGKPATQSGPVTEAGYAIGPGQEQGQEIGSAIPAELNYDEKEGGAIKLSRDSSPYDVPKQYASREQAQQRYDASLLSGGASLDHANRNYIYQVREKKLSDPGVTNQVIQVQNDGMRKVAPTVKNNPWGLVTKKKFNFAENNILDSDLSGNVVSRDAAFGNILNAENVFAKGKDNVGMPEQVQISFTQQKWKEAPNVTAPGTAGMNAGAQLKAAQQQRIQQQQQEIQASRQRQQVAMQRQQQIDMIRARKQEIYNQQIAEVRQQLEDQGYPEEQIDEAIDQFIAQQRQAERMQSSQQEQQILTQQEQQLQQSQQRQQPQQRPQTYNQVRSQTPESQMQAGTYNPEDYWDTEQEIDQYVGSGSGSAVPVRGFNPGAYGVKYS